MVRRLPHSIFACICATMAALSSAASAQTTYTSTDGPISIPANAAASVYPSTISIAGETAPIGKVTLTLTGLTHTNPDDLDVLLVSPTGAKLLLMSDCGGNTDVSNIQIVLDDVSANQLPDNGALTNASQYRPRNVSGGDSFSAPAPAGPYTSSFVPVRGTDANGNWQLFIVDDGSGSGSLASWSLTVTPALCVINTNNSGAGSLREAITLANLQAGRDYICFNIPGAGPHTITLSNELQDISGETVIDGLTQPGASALTWPPTLKIVLDGQNTSGDGLTFTNDADGSAVRGLVIQRFVDNGIEINGADNLTIQCNFIGTNADGSAAAANAGAGIRFNENSDDSTVGGVLLEVLTDLENGSFVAPLARNLISGNGSDGIVIVSSDNNHITANYIGVNAAGTAAIGNVSDGVAVEGSSRNNRIGVLPDGMFDYEEGNVISGNGSRGILLTDRSEGTVISGNIIGLSGAGDVDLGNAREGILINGSHDNRVGVTDVSAYGAERNFISGNGYDGIRLDLFSHSNVIAGNTIGLLLGGSPAGNDEDGVQLAPDAAFNLIGSDNDGTIDDTEGNTIAHNAGRGISASSIPADGGLGVSDGNIFSRNSIFLNGGIGIDLGADGVTPNDQDDVDGGANELKNFPVIASVSASGDVVGTYNSVANREYRIEFFASSSADASNHGEGEVYLGSIQVNTDSGGDAPINFSFTPIAGKPYITATATDLDRARLHDSLSDPDALVLEFPRGTSEFSPLVTIQGGGGLPEPNNQTVTTCEDTCKVITLTSSNADAGDLQYGIATLPTNGLLYQYSNGQGALISSPFTQVTDSLGRVVFCPDQDENGTPYATFQFYVLNIDRLGDTLASATVTVNVTPVNDRPTFGIMANQQNPIVFNESGGEQCKPGFIINFGGGGDDAEDLGQAISEVIVTEFSDPNGVLLQPFGLIIGINGSLCILPKPGKCGEISFRVAVRDNGGTGPCTDSDPSVVGIDTSFSIPVTITVQCRNDRPVAVCRDISIDLSEYCYAYSAAAIAAQINNGSSDPEDGTNVTVVACFYDTDLPVPDGYEFPLGSTTLTLKVTDNGIPAMGGTPASPPLTSTCTAKVEVIGLDCNNNGWADTCDIQNGRSVDCDNNWVPDECQCLWDNGTLPMPPSKSAGGITAEVVIPTGAQISHIGGGIPNSAKVADDFEFCNGYLHKVNKFRGEMLTNTLPFLRKAKLEFYEDCNGSPADVPFAKFLNGVIVETIRCSEDGYDRVTWEFDLCDEHLWLDGGKTYWVSLIAITDNVTQDLSFWLSTSTGNDPSAVLGSVPHKAVGSSPAPHAGGNPKPTSFEPWGPLDECCIGCVNMSFRMTGESCKVYWDNGPVDFGVTAGGVASGANAAGTARAVDNFMVAPCEPVEVCAIEAFVWTNCEPPTAFIEIYRDAPCSLNYDFDPPISQRIGPEVTPFYRAERTDAWSVMRTEKTVVINGITYRGYRLLFTDLHATLDAGRNYWISAGVNGTGSFAQSAFFAFNDSNCPHPGCGVKISPGYSRRVTPAPASAWLEGQRDFSFRVAIKSESIQGDMAMGTTPSGGSSTPVCPTDMDGNGVSDADDIFRFLDVWFTGCP